MKRKRMQMLAHLLTVVLFLAALPGSSRKEVQAGLTGLVNEADSSLANETDSPVNEADSPANEADSPANEAGGLANEAGGLAGIMTGRSAQNTEDKFDDAADAEQDLAALSLAAAENKTITVMLYLCGSNLESEGGAATSDITEILRSKYNTEEVNVLALTGGATKWRSGFSREETAIYDLSGSRPQQLFGGRLLNMGDPSTLQFFLSFCHTYYPAEKYALDLWDHGGGPMDGICWDSLSDSDNLTMQELAAALEGSFCREEPLEWIGFDACLMASAETAAMMSPYARYMIASEETEPGSGWSYTFLTGIEQDADGAETGRRIIESYFANTPADEAGQLTLSCLDLSRMDMLQERMDAYFSELTVTLSRETFSELSNMRQGSQSFGRAEVGSQDYDLVDLTDLTKHYQEQNPKGAEELLEALSQVIVASSGTMEGSYGLSVYHPYYNKTLYEEAWQQIYREFSFSTGYTQYIESFAALLMGKELGDWSALVAPEQDSTASEQAVFSLQLTEDQQASFASAQLLVLEDTYFGGGDGESYACIYVSDQVTLEDGVLYAEYGGKALYLVDENGEPLTEALSYRMVDGRILVTVNYISHRSDRKNAYTYFLFEPSETEEELNYVGCYVYDEETEQYTNRLSINPQDYDEIYLPYFNGKPTYEGDALLAFSEWESSGISSAEVLEDPNQQIRVAFIEEQITSSQKYVTFLITDTQANTHSSALQKVDNPNRQEFEVTSDLPENDMDEIRVTGIRNSSRIHPGIELEFEIVNQREEEYVYELTQAVMNGTQAPGDSYLFLTSVKGGGVEKRTLTLDETDLTNLQQLETLECTMEIHPAGNYQDMETRSFTLRMNVDVTEEAFQVEKTDCLGAGESSGVTLELYDLQQTPSGDFSMLLHGCSTAGEWRSVQGSPAFDGVLLESTIDMTIPPGGETWQRVELSNRCRSDWFDYSEKADLLGAFGKQELTELTLYISERTYFLEAYEPEQLTILLKEPVPLESGSSQEAEEGLWLPGSEEEGLQMKLERVELQDQKVLLLLRLENPSEQNYYLEFPIDEMRMDQEELRYNYFYKQIPANCNAYLFLCFEAAQEAEDEEEAEDTKGTFVQSITEREVSSLDLTAVIRSGDEEYRSRMTLQFSVPVRLAEGRDGSIPLEQVRIVAGEAGEEQ